MKKLVIHIGYPKTATTSLQENVFRRLHEIGKINCFYHHGRAFPNGLRRAGQTKSRSARPIRVNYTNGRAYTVKPNPAYFHGLLSDSRVNLASDESLSIPFLAIRNNPWKVKPRFELEAGNNASSSSAWSATPAIVQQLFGNGQTRIKILVTLRNQADLLESYFSQMTGLGLPHPDADSPSKMYFARDDNGRQKLRSSNLLNQFNFINNISEWSKLFGPGTMTILLYEDLVHRPAHFLRQISTVLELEEEDLVFSLFNAGKALNVKPRLGGDYATRKHILTKTFGKRLAYTIEPFYTFFCRRLRNNLGLRDLSPTKLPVSSELLKIPSAESTARFIERHASFTKAERSIIADYFRESNLSLASTFNLDLDRLRKYSYL